MREAADRVVALVLSSDFRRPAGALAAACLALLGACSAIPDEQIRGTDREGFLPSGRVRHEGERSKPQGLQGWEVASNFEGGYQRVAGEFRQSGGEADYRAAIGYAAWAPNMEYEGVQIDGFAGLAYGDIDVTAPGNDSRQDDVGPYLGFGARYRRLGIVEPYLRWSQGGSAEWSISRFEAGFELRPMQQVGIECAYALQMSRIESENADGGARIETDGLHVGVVLRF